MYASLSADFRRCKRLQRPSDRLPHGAYDQTTGVRNIFPIALYTGVANMFTRYRLSYTRCEDIGALDLAAPSNKTTDLFCVTISLILRENVRLS